MTKQSLVVLACVAALGAGALGASALAAGKPAPPKGTATISLPGDAGMAFKPGPGAGAAQANCLSCHSSAYVSTQPLLSKAQWTAEVVKMKNAYGAPIADDQVPVIVEYLTTNYGKP
jgi:mono/diheme cytochrome c family protein